MGRRDSNGEKGVLSRSRKSTLSGYSKYFVFCSGSTRLQSILGFLRLSKWKDRIAADCSYLSSDNRRGQVCVWQLFSLNMYYSRHPLRDRGKGAGSIPR
jgi:hypothetical protein